MVDLHVDGDDDSEEFDGVNGKRRRVICENVENRRTYKRMELLLTKPSYTLTIGCVNLRHETRMRLRYLLRKLVGQHNWVEASGVLATLLKGTCKEVSPMNNRVKYTIAMELIRRMENDGSSYFKKIKRLYNEMWEKKTRSYKNRKLKDGHVELELILSCLVHNDLESAIQNVISLQKQRESLSDPKASLMMGLTYYELWYSDLKKKLQESNIDVAWMPMETDSERNNSYDLVEDMKTDDAESIYETFSDLHHYSETSVINDKKSNAYNHRPNGEASEANFTQPVHRHQQFRSQGFYMNSIETSSENDGLNKVHPNRMQGSYVSSVRGKKGLQLLLPIGLPALDFLSSYRGSLHDLYKHALKHLHLALQSPPPISEAALLPLIQLLLLGDQVDEALVVLEKACNESSSVIPIRLRARLLECFDANNYDRLSTCFEDTLKKDPTCRHSLARLLHLHIQGVYASERLVEMIALHLEATYGDGNIWREFASCLLQLSQCDEDRASVCNVGQANNEERYPTLSRTIPLMFVEGMSGKTWRLRCKWWLNRHFSKDMLTSEMAAGDLQLMTYKAACAAHFYGREMQYVARVSEHVKEHDRTMSAFLLSHLQVSVGFCSNLVKK